MSSIEIQTKNGTGSTIYGDCIDWTMNGMKHTIKVILDKTSRDTLWNGIIPGRVKKLDFPFSKPYYIDSTYSDNNTLKIIPLGNLASIRDTVSLVIDGYSEEIIGRPGDTYVSTISGFEYIPL